LDLTELLGERSQLESLLIDGGGQRARAEEGIVALACGLVEEGTRFVEAGLGPFQFAAGFLGFLAGFLECESWGQGDQTHLEQAWENQPTEQSSSGDHIGRLATRKTATERRY
jgi:hypothetical protein